MIRVATTGPAHRLRKFRRRGRLNLRYPSEIDLHIQPIDCCTDFTGWDKARMQVDNPYIDHGAKRYEETEVDKAGSRSGQETETLKGVRGNDQKKKKKKRKQEREWSW